MLVSYLHAGGDLQHPALLFLVTQNRKKAMGDTQVRKRRRRMEVGEVERAGAREQANDANKERVKRKVHPVHESRAAFRLNYQIFANAQEQTG